MYNDRAYVFYHGNCHDGLAAAAVYRDAGGLGELIPYSYGDDFPDDLDGRDLIFLDCCPARSEIEQLFADGIASMLVVDHHPLAHKLVRELTVDNFARIDDLNFVTDVPENPCSGAELAWLFFNQSDGTGMPDSIVWIGKRDRWVFDEPEVRPFSFGLRQWVKDPEQWADDLFDTDLVGETLRAGEHVERAMDMMIADIARGQYLAWFGGYEVPHVNAPPALASDVAAQIYGENPGCQFVVVYSDNAYGRQVSLRSPEHSQVNLTELAEKFGGGGHRHAAGLLLDRPATI